MIEPINLGKSGNNWFTYILRTHRILCEFDETCSIGNSIVHVWPLWPSLLYNVYRLLNVCCNIIQLLNKISARSSANFNGSNCPNSVALKIRNYFFQSSAKFGFSFFSMFLLDMLKHNDVLRIVDTLSLTHIYTYTAHKYSSINAKLGTISECYCVGFIIMYFALNPRLALYLN